MPNFTPEDLLMYLYDETDPALTIRIREALQQDWTLREKLEVLKASAQRLDKVLMAPRQDSVDAILDYARKVAKVPH